MVLMENESEVSPLTKSLPPGSEKGFFETGPRMGVGFLVANLFTLFTLCTLSASTQF